MSWVGKNRNDYSGLESTCFYKVTTLCFNVYQINILNVVLVCKIPTRTALSVFYPCFVRLSHSYPTIFSESYYPLPSHTCVNVWECEFRISLKGSLPWNNFLTRTLKSSCLFKSTVKKKLLTLENKTKYFQWVSNKFKIRSSVLVL